MRWWLKCSIHSFSTIVTLSVIDLKQKMMSHFLKFKITWLYMFLIIWVLVFLKPIFQTFFLSFALEYSCGGWKDFFLKFLIFEKCCNKNVWPFWIFYSLIWSWILITDTLNIEHWSLIMDIKVPLLAKLLLFLGFNPGKN